MTFLHSLPEQAEAPPAPARPGETITQTKLNGLRLRQLQDLAKAFAVDIPPGVESKARILPFMIAAEQRGTFRKPPASRYHFLRAQLSHDIKLKDHERDELEQAIARAGFEEMSPEERLKHGYAKRIEDPNSYWGLQQRAKKVGIKNIAGKTTEALREMVEEKERELAGDDPGPAAA